VEQLPAVEAIEGAILVVCGQRVMLDADLARLYSVQTERLNQQVQRNQGRFSPEFAFRLTPEEWKGMYLQFAGTWQRKRRADRPPLAFTEHGCLMASNMLRSPRAVEVSVLVVRAFVRMRSALAASTELALRVDELAREVERQSGKLVTHDAAILTLLAEIRRLTRFPEGLRRPIGFTADLGNADRSTTK
jgi:hypothetical protein